MRPGDTLDGRYEITEKLGAGGMGEVFKATHTFLGSARVIKVVHPHISANADARERFLREARAATKVQHGNVATLHDFATLPDGAHYMVWEFIDGENLAERLRKRGTLPPKQAVHIAIQALRGLDAIHRAGIIHRDISPENLMITADDEVKIIDLGVAKLQDTDAVSQTRTGIFVGKLRYASPEHLGFLGENEKIDARADLYSLAMVLVELLTGRPPYEAKSPHEYFLLHAREPEKTTNVTIPPELAGSIALQSVLKKALARDRNERFATAREFIAALEEIERTLPNTRDMATVATPLDADATMRVTPAPQADTLHRATVRTNVPAPATVLTPLPESAPAAIPPPQMKRGMNPAYLVGIIAVIALIIGALVFWPTTSRREPILRPTQTATNTVAPAATTTTAAAMIPPPQPAQTAVTVTSAPAPVTTTTAAAPAPVVQTVPPVAPPRATATVAEEEAPRETAPAPRDDAFSTALTYVDGGDSDANERALDRLRRELRGTHEVALRAGAMQVQVARALKEEFPAIQFAPYADVTIRFEGALDRLGRGRKRRSATATISKGDRVIFRYELPGEDYRVGNTPAEAFARVLADAMNE
ncbi:MAG: protein kinase [Acidobacteriota bacterium]|nr:protein kinase [Acidobacteriota bacterium]